MMADVKQRVVPVRECSSVTAAAEIAGIREPAVVRGADIGDAPALWKDVGYLAKRCSSRQVRVHSSSTPYMDFITKNFSYK